MAEKRSHNNKAQAEKSEAGNLCWGRNPVTALLDKEPERCLKVLIAKGVQPHVRTKITERCKECGIVFQTVDNAALDRLTDSGTHQGVAAYWAQMKLWDLEEFLARLPKAPEPVMLLLCDHIQDPHNLGAVVRSAEAAGASGVMIPKRGGCPPTGVVIKTSAGAALRLPVVLVWKISQTIKRLQEENFWVTGLAMEGRETLFKEDLPPRSVIVVGAEGEVLGSVVMKSCDDIRFIPMKGETGSLNASVAAGIAMFEWTRSLGKNVKK